MSISNLCCGEKKSLVSLVDSCLNPVCVQVMQRKIVSFVTSYPHPVCVLALQIQNGLFLYFMAISGLCSSTAKKIWVAPSLDVYVRAVSWVMQRMNYQLF